MFHCIIASVGDLHCLAGPTDIYWHQQHAKQLATGLRPNLTSVFSLQPEIQAQMQSFVRKNQALANALHQKGRTPAALNALGNALMLLASLGMVFIRCGQPLVLALVTLRAGLQSGPFVKAASKPGSRWA